MPHQIALINVFNKTFTEVKHEKNHSYFIEAICFPNLENTQITYHIYFFPPVSFDIYHVSSAVSPENKSPEPGYMMLGRESGVLQQFVQDFEPSF